MTDAENKTARRPTSYDAGGSEGPPAPSNPAPSKARRAKLSKDLGEANGQGYDASIVFRCSSGEKAALLARAQRSGQGLSDLMREVLGLNAPRRLRPPPTRDPELVREVGRIGGCLAELARAVREATGHEVGAEADALVLAVRLVSVERAITALLASVSYAKQGRPPC